MVSSVLYETAEIVSGLDALAQSCARVGAELLVDAYHHLNVVPFDLRLLGLGEAFVTGGGYKYCQLGEGNAFLRVPPGRRMRPVLTGWFAEFAGLAAALDGREGQGARVAYPPGAPAFAGATYDPTSHYRAAAVFAFHREHGLTAARLHEINRRQVQLLQQLIERLDLDPAIASIESMPAERRGGFLAIKSPHAAAISVALRARNVHTDARGTTLRIGPAPYVTDAQIEEAVAALGAVARAL
jgi:kynureninase